MSIESLMPSNHLIRSPKGPGQGTIDEHWPLINSTPCAPGHWPERQRRLGEGLWGKRLQTSALTQTTYTSDLEEKTSPWGPRMPLRKLRTLKWKRTSAAPSCLHTQQLWAPFSAPGSHFLKLEISTASFVSFHHNFPFFFFSSFFFFFSSHWVEHFI